MTFKQLISLYITFTICILISFVVFVTKVAADPVAPDNPEIVRIESLPHGGINIFLQWIKNTEEANNLIEGYIVYYGDGPLNTPRRAGFGLFSSTGPNREFAIPDAVCYLDLLRSPQDLCFRVIAYTATEQSLFSPAACVTLTPAQVAGVCSPKGLTVRITPVPAP